MQLTTATLWRGQVLEAIAAGLSQAQTARQFNLPKYKVSRVFASMERQNLIRVTALTRPKFYLLTKQGEELLALFRRGIKSATKGGGFRALFRYEHLFFTSGIRSVSPDWERRLEKAGYVVSLRRHYRGFQLAGEEATVFVSGKSVWFLVKPLWSDSVSGALNRALEIVLGLKTDFESRFGFRLGYPERVVDLRRQEVAMTGGMDSFFPKGFFRQDGRVKFDCSTGEPEIETVNKTLALDDMNRVFDFTASIARGEVSVEELKAVKEFLPTLKEFVEALRKPGTERDLRELI